MTSNTTSSGRPSTVARCSLPTRSSTRCAGYSNRSAVGSTGRSSSSASRTTISTSSSLRRLGTPSPMSCKSSRARALPGSRRRSSAPTTSTSASLSGRARVLRLHHRTRRVHHPPLRTPPASSRGDRPAFALRETDRLACVKQADAKPPDLSPAVGYYIKRNPIKASASTPDPGAPASRHRADRQGALPLRAPCASIGSL